MRDLYRFQHKKKNKYMAVKTKYKGDAYDSKKEAAYAATLDLLKKCDIKSNRVLGYERQVRIPFLLDGELMFTYVLDFMVYYADGREEWVDVKGVQTAVFKLKKKIIEKYTGKKILLK